MMNHPERTLLVLIQDDDKSPVEEWLARIRDKATLVKIVFQIDKLSRGQGFTKSVKGVNELKIDLGPGYRVYYAALDENTIVVLVGAGSKKSQRRDIRDAQDLWNDFTRSGRPEAALREWQRDQRLTPISEGPAQEKEDNDRSTDETEEL